MSTHSRADTDIHALHSKIEGLASFNRHVAHDLRGPVVSVINASRFAQRALEQGDTEAAAQLLQLVARQSESMMQLIGELLLLSEADDARWTGAPVDLAEVARCAVEQVRHSTAALDAQPEVRLHGLPWVHGAAGLLRQVFVNLVANAFKFTRGVPSPMVEIGLSACAAGPVLYVRDNGIGFDASRADLLFQPFGRLHGREYPGHGIGLSLVRRVVERHGGRVWADAGAAGATFYFTLNGLAETPAAAAARGARPPSAHPAASTPEAAACRSVPAPAA
jgi:signal transduction histidine kinase